MKNPNLYTHESPATVERKEVLLVNDQGEVVGRTEVRVQPNTRKSIK